MNFNTDRQWLKRQAELEDNCLVSVGGLISAVEELEHRSTGVELTRPAFVRLLELRRRECRLTLDQVSAQLDVELGELVGIENDERYKPTPRTVHKLAQFLRVPAQKLLVLSGLVQAKDAQFQAEALRFAARSQPVEELSGEEHQALEEYVKFLCER
jgi:HTH-type transcriptional regulator, competence development regulator